MESTTSQRNFLNKEPLSEPPQCLFVLLKVILQRLKRVESIQYKLQLKQTEQTRKKELVRSYSTKSLLDIKKSDTFQGYVKHSGSMTDLLKEEDQNFLQNYSNVSKLLNELKQYVNELKEGMIQFCTWEQNKQHTFIIRMLEKSHSKVNCYFFV